MPKILVDQDLLAQAHEAVRKQKATVAGDSTDATPLGPASRSVVDQATDFLKDGGTAGDFTRSTVEGAFPAAAGMGGFMAAAPLGAPAGPVGSFVTGTLGALGAGSAANALQNFVRRSVSPDKVGADYEQLLAKGRNRSSIATLLGENVAMLPYAGFGLPTAKTLLPQLAAAGVATGLEGAQQIKNKEFDPLRLLITGGLGALQGKTPDYIKASGEHPLVTEARLAGEQAKSEQRAADLLEAQRQQQIAEEQARQAEARKAEFAEAMRREVLDRASARQQDVVAQGLQDQRVPTTTDRLLEQVQQTGKAELSPEKIDELIQEPKISDYEKSELTRRFYHQILAEKQAVNPENLDRLVEKPAPHSMIQAESIAPTLIERELAAQRETSRNAPTYEDVVAENYPKYPKTLEEARVAPVDPTIGIPIGREPKLSSEQHDLQYPQAEIKEPSLLERLQAEEKQQRILTAQREAEIAKRQEALRTEDAVTKYVEGVEKQPQPRLSPEALDALLGVEKGPTKLKLQSGEEMTLPSTKGKEHAEGMRGALVAEEQQRAREAAINKGVEASITKGATDEADVIERLRKWRESRRGNTYSLGPDAAIDAAVDVFLAAHKAGKDFHTALGEALEHAKKNGIDPSAVRLRILGGGTPPPAGKDPTKIEGLESAPQEPDYARGTALPIIRPQLEVVKDLGPTGRYLGKQLELQQKFASEDANRHENALMQPFEKYSFEEKQKFYALAQKERDTKQKLDSTLPPEERADYLAFRQSLKDIQEQNVKSGMMVKDFVNGKEVMRPARVDDTWIYHMMDPKVVKLLKSGEDSLRVKQLKKDFIDYKMQKDGITQPEAQALLDEITSNLGYGKNSAEGAIHFGATRKAEGSGLPESWREKDFEAATRRFSTRTAIDRNFFKFVESDPVARRALRIQSDPTTGQPPTVADPTHFDTGAEITDIGGNQEVSRILDHIAHNIDNEGSAHRGMQGAIRAGFLANPLRGLGDFFGVVPSAMASIPVKDLPAYLSHLATASGSEARAIELGIQRNKLPLNQTPGKLKFLADRMLKRQLEFSEGLFEVSNLAHKFSGSDLGERSARRLSALTADFIVDSKVEAARNGDSEALRYLAELSQGKDILREIAQKGQLSKQLRDSASADVVGYMQGGNDARFQPAWADEKSVWAPIFAVARWNIAQANSWNKVVLGSLKKGDIVPLLTSAVGAISSGYIMQELREKLGGSGRPTEPTLEEIYKFHNKDFKDTLEDPHFAYRVMNLASMGSMAGFQGTMLRNVYAALMKENPQLPSNPLTNVLFDTTASAASAAKAMLDGVPITTVLGQYIHDTIEKNVILAKVLHGMISESEKQKIADRNDQRDLEAFRKLSGTGSDNNWGFKNIPNYSTTEMRQFWDPTTEPSEQIAGSLAQKLVAKRENPLALQKYLQQIQGTARGYQGIPRGNMDEAAAFLEFNDKARGPEDSKRRLLEMARRESLKGRKLETFGQQLQAVSAQ